MSFRAMLIRHHRAVWTTLITLLVLVVVLWLLGVYFGVYEAGVHWRHR